MSEEELHRRTMKHLIASGAKKTTNYSVKRKQYMLLVQYLVGYENLMCDGGYGTYGGPRHRHPVGMYSARFATKNGSQRVRLWCPQCEVYYGTWSLPHKFFRDVMTLPVRGGPDEVTPAERTTAICTICGEDLPLDTHHFFPHDSRPEDYATVLWDKWPKIAVCRPCHRFWHKHNTTLT